VSSTPLDPKATPTLSAFTTVLVAGASIAALAYLVDKAYDGRRAVRVATEYVERYLLMVERCDRLEGRVERLLTEVERLHKERRHRR